MTERELNIQFALIGDHISNRRLKPAFSHLEVLIKETAQPLFLDEWRNLEETYRYMLKYTVEGINDPERQKIYRKLIVSAFSLLDKIYDAARVKFSSSLEYERKRSFSYTFEWNTLLDDLESYEVQSDLNSLLEDIKLKQEKEYDQASELQDKMVRLYYQLWFGNEINQETAAFVRSFYESELIPLPYKSFITSSIMLSLLRYFDPVKFDLLFEIYANESPEINQRALVALVLALFQYDERLEYYPAISGRLQLLNENPNFKRNLETVFIQLIRSKETEKIQKKITDEIIPEMIKLSPNLKDKINLDSLMNDSLDEDKNPEWEKIFKDSPGLMSKMEEFSEMQMEGADVFMSSFSMLKMFPFFSEVTNWFMPFFASNPAIEDAIDPHDKVNSSFIKAIDSAPILCNSDKYSFCFSLRNLPAENREFMAEGMKAEMDQFTELQDDEELTDPGKKAGFISNQFIQDLYRFYKLHPRKRDFEDIFSWRFDFHNKHILGEILKEDDVILRNVAEFYFTKAYYREATEVFTYLLKIEKSGELYQKLGYCYQKMNDYEHALETYKKAELFDLNRKWNLNKIALCYRNLKQPEEALEYYREVEKMDDENLNTQLNIGHCLLEVGEFEEALKCYFKVEYLEPGNKKVWRPIGWCSFVVGKKEQAEKYFTMLIESDPNKHDLMNMGHVQWSQGRRKEALQYYKKAITQTDFTESEFFDVFDEDLPYLIKQGVNQDDVPIMLDQLRYFVEE
ncbi:MAG TPA: tetratricopeptide repeat protein [Draconibacterium sp.]|nr:tetratricopeptide repeat protein [Draconibacterium sp.]